MAVNNKTYNNVVNFMCRLGEYHKQIHTVSVGDIYDINLQQLEKFALMHINPTNVTTGDSSMTYNFQIFICDIVSENMPTTTEVTNATNLPKLLNRKNNQQEVWNETLNITKDIIGMIRHSSRQSQAGVDDINFPLYFTNGQFTIEPFQERFDNLLTGWVFNVGIQVIDDFDTCDIPVTDAGAGY
tara:strand:- start:2418 stop:2972 length:555 start_codon:yes stop_codon:yes gene_type:complete